MPSEGGLDLHCRLLPGMLLMGRGRVGIQRGGEGGREQAPRTGERVDAHGTGRSGIRHWLHTGAAGGYPTFLAGDRTGPRGGASILKPYRPSTADLDPSPHARGHACMQNWDIPIWTHARAHTRARARSHRRAPREREICIACRQLEVDLRAQVGIRFREGRGGGFGSRAPTLRFVPLAGDVRNAFLAPRPSSVRVLLHGGHATIEERHSALRRRDLPAAYLRL